MISTSLWGLNGLAFENKKQTLYDYEKESPKKRTMSRFWLKYLPFLKDAGKEI